MNITNQTDNEIIAKAKRLGFEITNQIRDERDLATAAKAYIKSKTVTGERTPARNTPLERLRHHVTGAIERGEATAITEVAGEGNALRIPSNWHDCDVAEKQILDLQRQRDELLAERDHWKSEAIKLAHIVNDSPYDELLAALRETCNLLDRHEIEIPRNVLRAWQSVDTEAIAKMNNRFDKAEGSAR